MSHIDDGGPAFPLLPSTPSGEEGMSMRDYFAAAALLGIGIEANSGWRNRPARCAQRAYAIADAMIATRLLDATT